MIHHQIIDLTEYMNVPNTQGITPSQQLESMTGPVPLRKFLDSFPIALTNLIVHEDDILRTDDYRDNGLYFVFDQDGKRYVIQTSGNYMLPEQALYMLHRYNVRTLDDFLCIYGVQREELDLLGIQQAGEDYLFAEEESEIGQSNIYNPDYLPTGITVPTKWRPQPTYYSTAYGTYQPTTTCSRITAPLTVWAPSPTPPISPSPAMVPIPIFSKIPTYDVPSFLGKGKKTRE